MEQWWFSHPSLPPSPFLSRARLLPSHQLPAVRGQLCLCCLRGSRQGLGTAGVRWQSTQRTAPIGYPLRRGGVAMPQGSACQVIDKPQICVTADAFLMACPEVQTLGLYPPASQRSAQQSLLRKQRGLPPNLLPLLIYAAPFR